MRARRSNPAWPLHHQHAGSASWCIMSAVSNSRRCPRWKASKLNLWCTNVFWNTKGLGDAGARVACRKLKRLPCRLCWCGASGANPGASAAGTSKDEPEKDMGVNAGNAVIARAGASQGHAQARRCAEHWAACMARETRHVSPGSSTAHQNPKLMTILYCAAASFPSWHAANTHQSW